jgi:hypothetical protein
MKMNQHITNLGILYIAFNIVGVLAAAIVYVVVVGGGALSGDDTAIFFTSRVGTAVALLLVVLSVPGIIGAFGLLTYRAWARYMILVLGAMNLYNIPFGTALGIYTLWALTQEEAARLFGPRPAE